MKRRTFVKSIPLSFALSGSVESLALNTISKSKNQNKIMAFELPVLPYATNALEPHIDTKTMEIHHGKHHAAYVTNLNNAVNADSNAQGKSLEDLIKNISKYAPAIRNNGGGHWNHDMFWKIMSPNGGGDPKGEVAFAINGAFGSFENFKKELSNAGMTRFGSGWAWLCVDTSKNLFISSTPNQDNPLMDIAEKKGTPVLGVDVWEHAYYLNYQNRRADYLTAFFNVINWDEVNTRFKAAVGS
jgi:superoxide dismutase, Fe-Mn family